MFFSSFSSLKKILQDWHKSNSKQPRIAGSSIKRSTSWSWTVCVCGPTGPALLTGKHRVHWAALTTTTTATATTTTTSSSFLSTHTGLLFFLLVIPNFLILLVSPSHTHKPASSFFHLLCAFLPQPRSLTSSQAFPFFALINRLLPAFSHSSSMFTLTTDKLLRECCYLYFLVG